MLEYFRHKYPYTDFHELNLDWFLGEFKVIMDRVDAIDTRLTQAEADIDELQAEVLDLNERVEALSEALDILTNRVDNAEEDIVDLQNRLALAEGSISDLLSRMTQVETAVVNVTARVTTAENDIDTLGTDLSALTTRVDTAEDDIDALETRVGSDESSISGLDTRLTAAENTLATKSTVTITPTLQSGTKVADYTINGTNGSLYAPTATGGTITNVTGSNSATVTVANDVANVDVSYITTGKASGTTPATASTVEGENNTVTGAKGHAEGTNNTVGAPNSHAEGYGNTTTSNNAHVGGNNSVAGGVSSFAHGDNTKTTNTGECAVGSFNVSDNMTRFSVGGGTADNNRKNLFEVTSSGSAMVSGELHVDDDVYIEGQNIYINNASDVQKELSIDANNQLCIDSVPIVDEFVFTITPPSLNDGMRIENSSDKTASEIITAYNNGKTVIGVLRFNQQEYFFNLISNVAGSPVTQITISGFNSDRTIPSFYDLTINSSNGMIIIGRSPETSNGRIYCGGDLATTITQTSNPPTSAAVYDAIQNIPTYTLPTATANDLGGIKVGSGLSIDGNGVLSASGGDNTFAIKMYFHRTSSYETSSTFFTTISNQGFSSVDHTPYEAGVAYQAGKKLVLEIYLDENDTQPFMAMPLIGIEGDRLTFRDIVWIANNSYPDVRIVSFSAYTYQSATWGYIQKFAKGGTSYAYYESTKLVTGRVNNSITNDTSQVYIPTTKAVYDALQNLPVPELTTERVVATLNGVDVYEKTFALDSVSFTSSATFNDVDVTSENISIQHLISCEIASYTHGSTNELQSTMNTQTYPYKSLKKVAVSSTNIVLYGIDATSQSLGVGYITSDSNNILKTIRITRGGSVTYSATINYDCIVTLRYTKPTA